jgi:transposase
MAGNKRTVADLGAWLVFEDESGQGLRPPKGRTWGRRGRTPVVKVTGGSWKTVSRAMRKLVAARDWLTVFQLPPYASELNPVESVWSHLKRSLANLVKRTLSELTVMVKTRLRRIR